MTGSIRKGLHAWVWACAHRLEDIDVVQHEQLAKAYVVWARNVDQHSVTSAMAHWSRMDPIGRDLCTLLHRHLSRTSCIGRGLCTSLSHSRVWALRISQVNSAMVWAHRSGDINCGLRTTNKRHRPTTCTSILYASIVSCVQRLDDVGRGLCVSKWKHLSVESNIK